MRRSNKFPAATAHNQIRAGNILAHRASLREDLFAKSATCTFIDIALLEEIYTSPPAATHPPPQILKT